MEREFLMTRYRAWLSESRGLTFDSYDALWRWSTTDLAGFWESIRDYFALHSPTPAITAIADRDMPGAQWFPGAQSNYAQQIFRHVLDAEMAGVPALISSNESGAYREMSWSTLRRQVAALALHLQAQGLQPGDRVAAYMPNVPETIIAFLATVSVGGIWSVCAPDMGVPAVLERFRQIEPKILIACDGVTYAGRDLDRMAVVEELRAALPSVRHVIIHANLDPRCVPRDAVRFDRIVSRNDEATAAFEPMWLPFDHPLWIVYSSGTTGLPKPIVHGHGGVVMVALVFLRLHCDIGASYEPQSLNERYHWYSSTGWIMWNLQTFGLLGGTTCCIYDGNPSGARDKPDWGTLWRFVAQTRTTFFGAGAAFFASCAKADIDLADQGDLSAVRAIGTTGSPLSPSVQEWGTVQFERLGSPDMWWANVSGGTDFSGAFVGGNRELPLVPGQIQCRILGCAVEAWNEDGKPVIGEVGELVCTQPLPSMPLYFWGDRNHERYRASYFEEYPGVWRHGDWLQITPEGACIIYGRSDATINRAGLRMGTSEIYSAIESVPEVLDTLVVDLEYLGRDSYMPLFVKLREGMSLDEPLKQRINTAIRTALSPRFVPNDIFQVPDIPRTLSGKKQELPIKKLLLGHALEKIVNRAAMANPECLDWFVDFAGRRTQDGGALTP